MKRITNTTNGTFAIQAASPAMPPNPNTSAMIVGDRLKSRDAFPCNHELNRA
jgi:hypothetical protein